MNVSKIEWSEPHYVSATVKKIGKVFTSIGLVIDGVKVIHGSKGFFVAMPSRKVEEEWKDIVYFNDNEVREIFSKEVLENYHGLNDQTEEETNEDQTPEKEESVDQTKEGNWNWDGV